MRLSVKVVVLRQKRLEAVMHHPEKLPILKEIDEAVESDHSKARRSIKALGTHVIFHVLLHLTMVDKR